MLVREVDRPRERWWLHAALLLITLLATSMAGAALAGTWGSWHHLTLADLRAGLPFSVPLLAILLAHESGHYVTARSYRVNASPPYFLPFPPQLNLLGTLGAFIRLRSPIFDRRTLFDIGVAGPLAGVVVAIPVLLLGLALSTAEPGGPVRTLAHQYLPVGGTYWFFGDSMLLLACRFALGLHGPVALHPVALAGWVGVLVTSLNLLPLAQFDGGHVAFALFGRAQRWVARVFWLVLIPLGLLWMGWWLWAVLAIVIGRGRLGHPPVIAPERALDPSRRLVGWLAVVLFFVTFMPLPLAF
ncbi:MAG: site-2 protease family protein [Gemmatimonadaceae bacterium]|nr:site-2 protease family protein [Gemmatimonadaceae bacterium]